MKKKLVLGIVAATLALSLAIGGTLMLFTATSQEAENVVTLGNLKLQLLEKGGDIKDWTATDGITFDDLVPGDEVDKNTKIVLEKGSVDAYIRVRADVTVAGATEENEDSVKAKIAGFLGTLNTTVALEKFVFVPDAADSLSGYWYYADAAGSLAIADASADDVEAALVAPFTIPETFGNEFQDVSFTIAFTAYAVQADNSTATDFDATDSSAWATGVEWPLSVATA